MRVQITLDKDTKAAAEWQAIMLGYSSLAARLKVVAIDMARQYRVATGQQEPDPALEPKQEEPDPLPPKEQFKNWPVWFGPHMVERDPTLYRILVDQGMIS